MKRLIEKIIFQSRWILVLFYLGLIIAQILYCYKFCESLYELVCTFRHITEAELMLLVLGLIDITMIAGLIKMIISGSYQSFVNKLSEDHSERVSSGLLKVKMGSSLIGVSSIHLLQTFINSTNAPLKEIVVKCSIHIIFVVSTVALAYVDYLHMLTPQHTTKPTEEHRSL